MDAGSITVGVAGEQCADGTKVASLVYVVVTGAPPMFLSPSKARRMARDMRKQLRTASKAMQEELSDIVDEIERCANEVEASVRSAAGRA